MALSFRISSVVCLITLASISVRAEEIDLNDVDASMAREARLLDEAIAGREDFQKALKTFEGRYEATSCRCWKKNPNLTNANPISLPCSRKPDRIHFERQPGLHAVSVHVFPMTSLEESRGPVNSVAVAPGSWYYMPTGKFDGQPRGQSRALGEYFDHVDSVTQFGVPGRDPKFWTKKLKSSNLHYFEGSSKLLSEKRLYFSSGDSIQHKTAAGARTVLANPAQSFEFVAGDDGSFNLQVKQFKPGRDKISPADRALLERYGVDWKKMTPNAISEEKTMSCTYRSLCRGREECKKLNEDADAQDSEMKPARAAE